MPVHHLSLLSKGRSPKLKALLSDDDRSLSVYFEQAKDHNIVFLWSNNTGRFLIRRMLGILATNNKITADDKTYILGKIIGNCYVRNGSIDEYAKTVVDLINKSFSIECKDSTSQIAGLVIRMAKSGLINNKKVSNALEKNSRRIWETAWKIADVLAEIVTTKQILIPTYSTTKNLILDHGGHGKTKIGKQTIGSACLITTLLYASYSSDSDSPNKTDDLISLIIKKKHALRETFFQNNIDESFLFSILPPVLCDLSLTSMDFLYRASVVCEWLREPLFSAIPEANRRGRVGEDWMLKSIVLDLEN